MVGKTISHYSITEKISEGGMVVVYKARDTRLDRAVALKTVPETMAHDAERVRRFEREARAASALKHPNIVAVYDIGSESGVSFIVSELVVRVTSRDDPTRLRIAVQVADAVAAAHEVGVAHRDRNLTPELRSSVDSH